MAMGQHELRELRRQAEQAIAKAERGEGSPHLALAKTLMWHGELVGNAVEQVAVADESEALLTTYELPDKYLCGQCADAFPTMAEWHSHKERFHGLTGVAKN